jgi:group I intron endonuclease
VTDYPLMVSKQEISTQTGIYGILCKQRNKWYIGQAKNLRLRINSHFAELRRNSHRNDHLQRAYDKYGESSFETYILEYCDQTELNTLEKFYIDKYESTQVDKGYNIQYFDDNGKPTYTEYFKIKFAKAINPNHKIKSNDAKVMRELYQLGYRTGFIAEKYKMNITHVCKIISNRKWYDPSYRKPQFKLELTLDEKVILDKYLYSGKSVMTVAEETGIYWDRIRDYFEEKGIKKCGSSKVLILNTETGVYYDNYKDASNSTDHISLGKLRQWLNTHPKRNKSSFILCNTPKKPNRNITILDKSTGVYYTSYREAAKIFNVTSRTMSRWLTDKKEFNQTALELC